MVLLENGYAQIVGRIKDTIIRGGENIEPKDIEEVIMKHTDVVDVQVNAISGNRFEFCCDILERLATKIVGKLLTNCRKMN